MTIEGCTTESNDVKIVVEENKRKFIINNKARTIIKKVEVDGCLFGGAVKKCDYLFDLNNASKDVLYVELKGRDIKKAVEQLENTIKMTEKDFKGYTKKCYAVTSRIPKGGPSVQQLQIKFYKATKSKLNVKNGTVQVEGS